MTSLNGLSNSNTSRQFSFLHFLCSSSFGNFGFVTLVLEHPSPGTQKLVGGFIRPRKPLAMGVSGNCLDQS